MSTIVFLTLLCSECSPAAGTGERRCDLLYDELRDCKWGDPHHPSISDAVGSGAVILRGVVFPRQSRNKSLRRKHLHCAGHEHL